MASYNLMKRADRDRLKADRVAEIEAIDSGTWPRDLNDDMRWGAGRHFHDKAEKATYARRMCANEVDYLRDLQRRIDAKVPDLLGWEA